MKAEFARLYETISMPFNQARCDAHWANVQAVSRELTQNSTEALIRTAFATKREAGTAISSALRAKLSGDLGAIGDQEFKLFATAALADALQRDDATAARAATLICTTSFGGLRHFEGTAELVTAAGAAVRRIAVTARKRPALESLKGLSATIDPAESVAAVQPMTATDIGNAFSMIAKACNAALANLVTKHASFEQALRRFIAIQDEELDMLWWLQGGVSSTTGQPFAEVDDGQRPLVLASELAAVTYALPGVPSIAALLARAEISSTEPLSIATAVQAANNAWIRKIVVDPSDERISPVTTPIHEALKRRLEDNDKWVPLWASVCEVAEDAALTPLELASAFYLEQLVMRK